MNNLIKHIPRNEIGRDFVVGDIHGCFDALSNALHDVSFDESKDRLFSVGDLIDRGNQSEESIDVNFLKHIASVCEAASKELLPKPRQSYEDDSEYIGNQILEELENICIVIDNLINA